MKLLFSILILITVLPACSTCLAQGGPPPADNEYFVKTWVEYKSQSGKYKIKFPKTPRESTEVQEGIGGQATVNLAEYKGILLYVTTHADSPSHVTDPKSSLSTTCQQWLAMNAARRLQVIKNEEVTVAGYPARFLQVETPRDVVRVRWIMVQDRIYYQFVAAPKHKDALESENGYEKLAMGFLNSFELTK